MRKDLKKKSSVSFIRKILDSLFGSTDADAEKRRQLKAINKKLLKSRYNKFYKYSGNEALPGMAKFFYEIYKVIFPAQAMFQAVQNPNFLKHLVIDYTLPEEQKKIEESLSEENIIALSKEIPLAHLKEQVEKRVALYSDYFTLERITIIDNIYKQMASFKDFCTFDYYFLLKKFDKILKESDFNVPPQFGKINCEYIIEDLKNFISIVWAIPFESDWSALFKILKAYKGVEPVSLAVWKKLLARMQILKTSGAMEMILKLTSSNPGFFMEVSEVTANIIEPHIDRTKHEAEAVIQKLTEQEKNNKTNDLAEQLFGGTEIVQLKNYSEAVSAVLKRKGLNTYIHAQALNYLKAFLLEVMKKDMREYYDVVVVRGQWESQALCAPISEGYNYLLSVSDQIIELDSKLAEDGQIGIKIKTLLPKTDRDGSSKNIVNRLIAEANEAAYNCLIESVKSIVNIGKIVKSLIDDAAKKSPSMVTNWKELDHYTDIPVREMSIALYKKIYLFSSLIKACMQDV